MRDSIRRRLEVESLETRLVLSGSPGLAANGGDPPLLEPIDDVTLLAGAPLHIPLDGSDPDGGPLTYSVASSNEALVSTFVPQNNRSLKITVASFGEMVIELFEQRAPRVTQRIVELAESGFYDGVTFHRVIDDFVIQGGDPTGNGSGGSPLGDFDDQFHPDLQHTRTGVLSMAKSFDDTNDSQFFITEGPTRHLDFNHSIFGQLVEGEAVREAISGVPTDADDQPLDPVVMTRVEVIRDQENALVMLKADEGQAGEADVTVTVSDAEGHSAERSFHVTVTPDPANGGPYLDDIPLVSQLAGNPIAWQLHGNDVEGDLVFYDALEIGTVAYDFTVDHDTGEIVITPPDGFAGTGEIFVGVRAVTQSTTQDTWDTQVVSFKVRPLRLPGDMNFDTRVDFDDIDPFVQGLEDPAGYEPAHGAPATDAGDIDGDGDLDFDDIPEFVALLGGVSASARAGDAVAVSEEDAGAAHAVAVPVDSREAAQVPGEAWWPAEPRDRLEESPARSLNRSAAADAAEDPIISSDRHDHSMARRADKRLEERAEHDAAHTGRSAGGAAELTSNEHPKGGSPFGSGLPTRQPFQPLRARNAR